MGLIRTCFVHAESDADPADLVAWLAEAAMVLGLTGLEPFMVAPVEPVWTDQTVILPLALLAPALGGVIDAAGKACRIDIMARSVGRVIDEETVEPRGQQVDFLIEAHPPEAWDANAVFSAVLTALVTAAGSTVDWPTSRGVLTLPALPSGWAVVEPETPDTVFARWQAPTPTQDYPWTTHE